MLQRFNFFDVYAYLIPGVAFIALIWLPFGVVKGQWPSGDFASGLLLLVAAYIVGHVLYYPATRALPTEGNGLYKDRNCWRAKKARQPSEFLLDIDEGTFPEGFKRSLQGLIRKQVGREVNVEFDWDAANETERNNVKKERELAFFLCRSVLITGGAPTYAEQFQGLFELMRGLTLVFAIGFAYDLGWASAVGLQKARLATPGVAGLAVGLFGAVLVTKTIKDPLRARIIAASLMIASFVSPFWVQGLVSSDGATRPHRGLLLAAMAIVGLLFSVRFYSAYRPFAKDFAVAIYRDFYAYVRSQDKDPGSTPAPPATAPTATGSTGVPIIPRGCNIL
jgi:hypothetical protein